MEHIGELALHLGDRVVAQYIHRNAAILGLAHALGKPTLIVANITPGHLPAMINNVPCIPLPTNDQLHRNIFLDEVAGKLRVALAQDRYNNIAWGDNARRRYLP